jgi:hypothetical protein
VLAWKLCQDYPRDSVHGDDSSKSSIKEPRADHDDSFRGWDGPRDQQLIEPTALAIRHYGPSSRVEPAVGSAQLAVGFSMIMCPKGGWNCGNLRRVDGEPLVLPTGGAARTP